MCCQLIYILWKNLSSQCLELGQGGCGFTHHCFSCTVSGKVSTVEKANALLFLVYKTVLTCRTSERVSGLPQILWTILWGLLLTWGRSCLWKLIKIKTSEELVTWPSKASAVFTCQSVICSFTLLGLAVVICICFLVYSFIVQSCIVLCFTYLHL